jgi:pimeloyl-ACP methyl ester carboxylesterase
MWEKQVAAFRDFHCLVPDLPGHGKSKNMGSFSIRDSAVKIAAMIKEKTLDGKAYVVGHSLGAQISVELLALSPEIIEKAVVGSALVKGKGMPGWVKFLFRGTMPLAKKKWFAKLQAKALKIPPEYFSKYYEDSKTFRGETLLEILEENARYTLPRGLSKCYVPTLVLSGEKESKEMLKSVWDISAIMPKAEGYLIADLGHSYCFESPELFNRILKAWFNEGELL